MADTEKPPLHVIESVPDEAYAGGHRMDGVHTSGLDDRQRITPAANASAARPPVKFCIHGNTKHVPRDDSVRGLFPRKGVATMYGPSGHGKSFLTAYIAMRLAMGDDLFGFEVDEPVGVIYCAFEAFDNVQDQIIALEQDEIKRAEESGAPYPDFLPFASMECSWNLRKPDQFAAFIEDVKHVKAVMEQDDGPKVGLVIIDTVTAAIAGAQLGDSSDVTEVLTLLKHQAQDLECLFLGIGHTGKDASRGMLGSVTWKTESDVFLELRADLETDPENPIRSLYAEKVKRGRDGYTITYFDLDIVTIAHDDKGRPETTCIVRLTDEPDHVVDAKTEQKSADETHVEWITKVLADGPKTKAEILAIIGDKDGKAHKQGYSISGTRLGQILPKMKTNGVLIGRQDRGKHYYELIKRGS